MAPFQNIVWIIILAIGFAGLLAFLHTLAGAIRNQSYLHDLRVECASLRNEYMVRMEELNRDPEEDRAAQGKAKEAPPTVATTTATDSSDQPGEAPLSASSSELIDEQRVGSPAHAPA